VIKNVIASQLVYESIRGVPTVGVISHDEASGISEIAEPLGPVFAVTPITNPTSTAIFKILIALKTRNPIIISPHRRSQRSVAETARICTEAALAADAPEDCIQMATDGSRELTQCLMSHHGMALILATGGTGLVTAAYSSGTPAIGVGPGNVPVLIDPSANLAYAVSSILASKTFDNGTVCASEQAIVVEQSIAGAVRAEMQRQGFFFLDCDQKAKVEGVAIDPKSGAMSPEIVGQSVESVCRLAGITVPQGTRVLVADLAAVGPEEPLSGEVLAPIIAFYVGADANTTAKLCVDLNYRGGMGHTASIYANDEQRIAEFSGLMNAGRVVVNTPSTQGAVGSLLNTLAPSFTLGCGSGGKNITTENVTARHLLNIKRVCRKRPNEKWHSFDTSRYLDPAETVDGLLADYHSDH
jgi:acetaldehyde dehydrogenase/alcohol dehydrogenase